VLRLLVEHESQLRARYGIEWRVTGVASRRLGWIADAAGLDAAKLLRGEFPAPSGSVNHVRDWLHAAQADVLFEASSLNIDNGRPALDHIRAALEHGAHAITANKGPLVFGYQELTELAAQCGLRFLFESTVMDGAPIFSMFRDLPLVKVNGFHGIFNSTTNVILSGMEEGLTFEQSLARAQEMGIAETDASYDIDGWDATVKVCALANVLMGAKLRPSQVAREGIGGITAAAVHEARAAGKRYKLVGRARREKNDVRASLGPELLPITDPMAQVEGASSIVCFETNFFPGLTITETNPGLETTAYGLLADLVRAVA
jgi:homoserine dehydrogenase